eukprot:TRINITY_DN13497_c0_g1_i1.p1 TRINITY_DN13497_c0_g1~~TRINITY_DN13497_c0_g1_i1.p1  ORF type:complete len:395 (+),score=59.28 TRINITY_DN13497_c0_g1_i1:48-1232(+)
MKCRKCNTLGHWTKDCGLSQTQPTQPEGGPKANPVPAPPRPSRPQQPAPESPVNPAAQNEQLRITPRQTATDEARRLVCWGLFEDEAGPETSPLHSHRNDITHALDAGASLEEIVLGTRHDVLRAGAELRSWVEQRGSEFDAEGHPWLPGLTVVRFLGVCRELVYMNKGLFLRRSDDPHGDELPTVELEDALIEHCNASFEELVARAGPLATDGGLRKKLNQLRNRLNWSGFDFSRFPREFEKEFKRNFKGSFNAASAQWTSLDEAYAFVSRHATDHGLDPDRAAEFEHAVKCLRLPGLTNLAQFLGIVHSSAFKVREWCAQDELVADAIRFVHLHPWVWKLAPVLEGVALARRAPLLWNGTEVTFDPGRVGDNTRLVPDVGTIWHGAKEALDG